MKKKGVFLLVVDHPNLLSSQFLAKALSPEHVSYTTVTLPDGPRSMKKTLYSSQIHELNPYLRDGKIPHDNLKRVTSDLHCKAVSFAMCRLGPNKLLGRYPPTEIHPSEMMLSRATRCVLTQLRSDYCFLLRTYLFTIKRPDDQICPVSC